jgi:hypothetical protein
MAQRGPKDRSHLWKKGQSGNPSGRPKGSGRRRKLFLDFVEPYGEKLAMKAIQMALDGNENMLRMFLSRLLPGKPREEGISLDINLSAKDQYNERCKLLDSALDDGSININTYKVLSDSLHKRFEMVELQDRIMQLEQKLDMTTEEPSGKLITVKLANGDT